MKPVKKKPHLHHDKLSEEFIKKPVKKTLQKRDRKLSIYDPLDDEEPFDDFDSLLDDDPDAIEEDDDY
jgi:hypothetical protein